MRCLDANITFTLFGFEGAIVADIFFGKCVAYGSGRAFQGEPVSPRYKPYGLIPPPVSDGV